MLCLGPRPFHTNQNLFVGWVHSNQFHSHHPHSTGKKKKKIYMYIYIYVHVTEVRSLSDIFLLNLLDLNESSLYKSS